MAESEKFNSARMIIITICFRNKNHLLLRNNAICALHAPKECFSPANTGVVAGNGLCVGRVRRMIMGYRLMPIQLRRNPPEGTGRGFTPH